MENMIDVKTIVKNAKSACQRDGYPQIVYTYEDGDIAFTRLYSELKLTNIKEVLGVVDGGWGKGAIICFIQMIPLKLIYILNHIE